MQIVSNGNNLYEMSKPIFWENKTIIVYLSCAEYAQRGKGQMSCCNNTQTSASSSAVITKTRLYNFDPLKPHFYTVKLGFQGVYNIFLISAQNIDCGYSLEPPRRGGSNEYPQSMFWAEIWKISEFFYLKIFSFLGDEIFYIFE